MTKVIVVFGSTTGMTEMSATKVVEGLKEGGIEEVVLKNVIDTNVSELDGFDNIVFGCSTWDYGALQYDFDPYYSELKNYNFKDKKVAIFGTGDKSYGDTYCLALKIIQAVVEEQDGTLIVPNLEIECDLTDERMEMVKEWGVKVAEKMRKA